MLIDQLSEKRLQMCTALHTHPCARWSFVCVRMKLCVKAGKNLECCPQ